MSVKREIKKRLIVSRKRPQSAVKHVGIEIEFVAPYTRTELVDALADADLENYVELKDDGSVHPNGYEEECSGDCRWSGNCDCCGCCNCGEATCSSCDGSPEADSCCCDCECECSCACNGADPEEHGHELCVLATEREYRRVVKRVCDVLKAHSAYVNKTCGLHVHLDVRSRDAERCYQNFYNAQGALFKLVPHSRRDNKYCRFQHASTLRESDGDRYYAINPTSINRHNTIEIRLHSGSVAARKITSWVDLLITIADGRVDSIADTVGEIDKQVKLKKRVKQYFIERQRKFRNVNATDAA